MNLLILTNNPERASFRQRFEAYLDCFEANGISCDVAKISSGKKRKAVLNSASGYDGVLLHKKGLNFFDARRLRKHARRIIYNFDDAIMFSPSNPAKYSRSHFVPFRRTAAMSDMIICGSEYLASKARPFNSNVRVLPIGLNISDYGESTAGSDTMIRLVWIGSESTLRYLEVIRDAIEQIGSRTDNVLLRVICEDFPKFENMSVEQHIWSAATRGHDLAACDIGLAPLPDEPFAQGKCSFKVLEYSASGLPVVASPVGTNRDHLVDGKTGYLAADTSQWIDRCMTLIEDRNLREEMGKEGTRVATGHDVEHVGKRFVDLIRECVGQD